MYTATLHEVRIVQMLHQNRFFTGQIVGSIEAGAGDVDTLLCPEQWENAQEDVAAAVAAIFDRSQAMEREVPMPLFERIFAGDMTVTEARAMLNREAKVWTWGRIANAPRGMAGART